MQPISRPRHAPYHETVGRFNREPRQQFSLNTI
jgi:hypothetical protein